MRTLVKVRVDWNLRDFGLGLWFDYKIKCFNLTVGPLNLEVDFDV